MRVDARSKGCLRCKHIPQLSWTHMVRKGGGAILIPNVERPNKNMF